MESCFNTEENACELEQEIEKKKKILCNMLERDDVKITDNTVVEISQSLDDLLVSYIKNEILKDNSQNKND